MPTQRKKVDEERVFNTYSKSTIASSGSTNEEGMIAVLERPRSPIAVTKREYKELLDRLSPKSYTRVRCCAAQLISYFEHWHQWKEAHYPTRWIYQPLTEIRHDLMDAFTIHVVREAIAVLQSLGFLSVRRNSRAENLRNGQDRTHQYLLHSDRIKLALENLFSQPAAETLETPPFVNFEIPSVNSETPSVKVEIPKFTVETYTQIPYSDSCPDSCSLKKEREKNVKFLSQEDDSEVSQSTSKCEDVSDKLKEDCDNNLNLDTDQFSAASALKCVESPQDDVEPLPTLKSDSEALLRSPYSPAGILRQALPQRRADRSSGFRSDTERDGFYQALLELGKSKGKNSPVGWASAIIKSIDAGDPCQYLQEYREGLLVGSCEQQEWEVAPGQPYEQFVVYLKTKNKKTGMTDEEAIALVHRQLADTNVAKSLWESCKRSIVRCQDDWEKQKRLGVNTPYIPPELLPPQEISLEQAAIALQGLQSNSVQVQEVMSPGVELALKAVVESAPAEESSSPEAKPALIDLQTKLDLPLQASVVKIMVKANPQWGYRIDDELKLILPVEGQPPLDYLQWLLNNKLTAGRARQLIDRNPEWGFLIDDDGHLWDF
jgi:hypothetical protein